MIAQTDDNGNTTEWTHDVNGQALSETKDGGTGDPINRASLGNSC